MTTPTGILFDDPRSKPLSTAGVFQPGCYLCFFTTGTTTPTNVYADGALSTPLSQPTAGSVNPSAGTVSASDGRFVAIYLNPATVYRVQLYSAAGSLLADTDPYVVPLSLSALTTGAALTFSPTSGITTINGAPGVAGAIVNVAGNNNSSIDLVVANSSTGAASTAVLAVNDGGSNYGFSELQAAGTSAAVTNGSSGLALNVGTSGTFPLFLCTNDTAYMQITSAGVIQGWGPTSSAFQDMTPDSGTFTAGTTGATSATASCAWKRVGKMVTIEIGGFTGTGTAGTFTLTGIPAAIQPPTTAQNSPVVNAEDNTVQTFAIIGINAASSSWTLFKVTNGGSGNGLSSSAWTSSGTKGLSAVSFSYMLN